MPTFNDSENIINLVPEGDYKFTVVDFAIGLSSGGKTSGSEKYEVKYEVEKGKEKSITYDTLIDHELCAWKLDTFLKCSGVRLAKGERFTFRKDEAESQNIRWINPLGLRGWFKLFVDEYQGKKRNKVSMYYTDKEKLAQVVVESKEDNIPFA